MFTHRGAMSSGLLLVQAKVSAHPLAAKVPGHGRVGHLLVIMVDTGARFSLVTEGILTTLGMVPVGTTDVRTSLHHVVERPAYRIVVGID